MCHDFLSPPRAGEGLCGPGDAQCAVELEDVIFCRAVGYGEVVREFAYRFNRRKFQSELFPWLLKACLSINTVTYKQLVAGL